MCPAICSTKMSSVMTVPWIWQMMGWRICASNWRNFCFLHTLTVLNQQRKPIDFKSDAEKWEKSWNRNQIKFTWNNEKLKWSQNFQKCKYMSKMYTQINTCSKYICWYFSKWNNNILLHALCGIAYTKKSMLKSLCGIGYAGIDSLSESTSDAFPLGLSTPASVNGLMCKLSKSLVFWVQNNLLKLKSLKRKAWNW